MKPEQWIVSRDTGVSSETIWSVMMGVKPRWAGVPLDVDDFGRCVRLLTVVPEFRPRIHEVTLVYPEWKPLIDNWGELERLYWAWEADNRSSKAWHVFYNKITPLIGNNW
jgi:hypothetical protein